MEHNRRLLGCQRKIRPFRANFEKMLAIVQHNMIQIMTAASFRIIDVIEGHINEIRCIDVSQISKAVVSISQNLLLVHAPIKSDGVYMADHVISLGTLKWKEYWRYDLQINVRNLSISPIGDFFSLSGDGFMTLWIRDTPTDFSYSQFVYQSRDEPKNVIASVIQHKPDLGFIIQQDVSNDGRLIFCLEQRSSTLKVYYQDKVQKSQKEKDEEKNMFKNEFGGRSAQMRYYGGYNRGNKEDRVDVVLEYNPYANLDQNPAAGSYDTQARQGDLNFQQDELSEYQIPKHKNPIDYFKIMHHDIFECEKRYLPNILMTVTNKNEVFLWYENLLTSDLQFTCVHVFRGYQTFTFFDAIFLDFPPINPKRYVELKSSVSRLFDTSQDKILQLKKEEENSLSIYQENYVETSIDWILILNDQIIDIYKAEGLRNFPLRNITVLMWNRVKLNYNPRDFYGICKIISASCRDFNDILSVYALNTNGQLIKLRKDFKEQGQGKWKIDKVAILKKKYIEDVIVHKQLPVLAHLMNNTEIYFYIEEKTKNRIVKESQTGGSMKFLGAYSVFHHHTNKATQKANQHTQTLRIKQAKWVNSPFCQLIVQFTNDSLALITSQTQLRILSHKKFQDEYMKLWEGSDKSRNQIAEKWQKLYEIHFNQPHSEVEHIVDYEIIGSQILEGGFIIRLAIFTDFNQYLVYETQTTLLANLKTLSQTKLLYHMFTPDNPLKLLSSVSIDDKTTIMALMTEIDPKRQRPELIKKREEDEKARQALIKAKEEQAKQKPLQSHHGFDDFGDDDNDSDDDGDIFSQFSGPSKKKDEKFLKKKPIQEEEKIEEILIPPEAPPLKHQLIIKMIQFDSMTQGSCKEIWRVELAPEFKAKLIKSTASKDYFAFMTRELVAGTIGEQTLVYMYDMLQQKYLGYINLSQTIGASNLLPNQIDFIFSVGTAKGSLTVYHQDQLYLIGESAREGQPGKWSLVRKIDKIMNLAKNLEIKSVSLHESFLRKQIMLVNKEIYSVREKFTLKDRIKNTNDFTEEPVIVVQKHPLYHIYTQAQKSFAFYDPKVLKSLFVKGYGNLVLKFLVQLNKSIDVTNNSSVSEFLDFDLQNIMEEVSEYIESLTSTQSSSNQGKKKQETASSIFDDFYGGFDNENDNAQKGGNNDKKEPGNKKLEQEFEECFDSLVSKIRNNGQKALQLVDNIQRLRFIEFLRKFRQIYKKEFFADSLTSILLRDLFFETEDVGEDEEAKIQREQKQSNFNVAEYIAQMKSKPAGYSKASIGSLKQWNSLQTCLALHSEMQDVIFNELSDRFEFETNLNYDLMKKLCIPVWLKDVNKLKNLVTIIAKNEYKTGGEDFGKQSKAEKTALWYIMLDKKDQLIRLYKQEPAYKKVYELLLNDFTVQKYKTTAEKNALVLMSKKNFTLACAFFLLAGNLRDAVKVATDKMKDSVLAILMARLFEKDNFMDGQDKKQESWQDIIYNEEFVQRGERLGDPYLQNIGHWQRKDYLKAVNAFQVDPSKFNNLVSMFNQAVNPVELNLYYTSVKMVNSDIPQHLLMLQQMQQQLIQESIPVPSSCQYDYHALDILKTIRKSTILKRALQQSKWTTSNDISNGGGDSIFDDFFSGPTKKTAAQKKQEEEAAKQKQEENKLVVEDHKVLEYVALRASQTGFNLQALVVMAENIEHLEKVGPVCKQVIAYSLITDMVNQPNFQYSSIIKLKKTTNYLIEKLNLDAENVRAFVLNQFKYVDSFLMHVNYIAEEEGVQKQKQIWEALQCVEEEAMKMVDFVHSLADFPFALIEDGKHHEFVQYTIRKAVNYLETLAESYIIIDMQEQTQKQSEGVGKAAPMTKAKQPGYNQMISMTIAGMDEGEEDEGNYEFTVEEEKGNLNLKNLNLKSQRTGVQLPDEIETPLQKIGAKTRITLVLYLGLLQVSMMSHKYQLVKELLSDLKNIFGSNSLLQDKDSSQVSTFMQKLKTQIQKLKYTLSPKKKEEVDVDDFELKFTQDKPKTKDELEEDRKLQKINQFFALWLQYIIGHYMQQLVRMSYENNQIKGLIDHRPSIIENYPLNQVVELILNPRILSSELLKKYINLDRILENVTTYYFENFLNLQERYIISQELQNIQEQIKQQKTSIQTKGILDIIKLFGSDNRFISFAHFIDLNAFVRHLRDHELSLVYHRNHDYSYRAVERTQEIFENGIDIFRMRTETVSSFAFDRCGLDLVTLALQGKGIREIPIKKTLLYRARSTKGHQLVEDELGSWHECLNRFNRIAKDQADVKPQSEAIIAAVEKLYQYKTINYAKKQRRRRGTFFLDYELSPPDMWSGLHQSEYLKSYSDADITHEDYTNVVESHPYLPLFVSGNSRGMLCLWEFNQLDDRSLDHWITEPINDPKNIDIKKSTIKKVSFNSYGDKMYCSNGEGNIFVFNFDNMESSRTTPIYTLKKGREDKFSDFEILNSDSVYAVTAQKPKHLWIYDTLMSSRGGLVMEAQVGGTIIQPVKSKNQVLLLNGDKPGSMILHDLRMNKTVFSTNLHTDEVTSVAISESETTLVSGFRDGIIKIFNMEKEFEVREAYSAFSQVGGKKGGVAQVRIHPTNGALYASSTIGNLKLFRTRV